ncbi:IS66 family transposase [Aurantimonas coralicida]|jgi:transposase|uniref:IS66 family transposase n=1 Tax=Aurantimonas coralicida TaxID=182270 RepID=UPI001D1804EC|nr:IS66 family transposase [Aurantimonas coralicida]MCC4300301.1 IS66 family transposase [Aurantimonas coralicida]
METAFANLPSDPAALRAIILTQAAELAAREAELRFHGTLIERLKAQLAALRRARFGTSSEKLDRIADQLELALEEIEANQAQDEPQGTDAEATAGSRTPRSKPSRRPLPDHLPRYEVRHEAPCTCAECGGTRFLKDGEDVTEILDYVPASFRVVRHVRPRLVCRDCDAIIQAERPSLPIERGKPGPGLLAHVLVSKYADHLPLYRQSRIYEREGVKLSRSTLADWVGRSADLLAPLVEAVRAHVLSGDRLHGDDTPVPVLEPGKGRTKQGRLWAYVRDGRPCGSTDPPAVAYRYSPDRKGHHPREHLASFAGILHADGYAGFAELYRAPLVGDGGRVESRIAEAACWAHARRKFFDLTASGPAPVAGEALKRIGELYEIERSVRGQSATERLKVRQAQTAPKVEALRSYLERELARLSGKSPTAGAIRYALSRWPALCRYLGDGRIEIDNNAAERAIRPVTLGRKNWLFAGSDEGGVRAAGIMTLIETAKLNGLDPEAWLRDVIARIHDHSARRIDELLPWNAQPDVATSTAPAHA